MIDTLEAHGYKDFNQRYQGCFCLYNNMLVKIRKSTDNGVEFEDKDGNKYNSADRSQPFLFMALAKGWYNTKQGPVFLSRRAQRQWTRGVSDATVAIRRVKNGPSCWGLKALDFAALADILSEEKKITFSGFPYALNKNFALSDSYVFLWDQVIGSVEKEKVSVLPLYLNEFNQVASQINIKATPYDL
jgi:hypothetical protein